jgi:hypothetical protein
MKTEALYWPGDAFTFLHHGRKLTIPNGEFNEEPEVARRLLAQFSNRGLKRIPPAGALASTDEVKASGDALHEAAVLLAKAGADRQARVRFSETPGATIPSIQNAAAEARQRSIDARAARIANKKANEEARAARLALHQRSPAQFLRGGAAIEAAKGNAPAPAEPVIPAEVEPMKPEGDAAAAVTPPAETQEN